MTNNTESGRLLTAGDLVVKLAQIDPRTVVTWTEWDDRTDTTVIVGLTDIDDEGFAETGWLDDNGGRDQRALPAPVLVRDLQPALAPSGALLSFEEWCETISPDDHDYFAYLDHWN